MTPRRKDGQDAHSGDSIIILPWNDIEILDKRNPGQIAAIIIEPIAGNMGCVVPNSGFLEGLRKLCDINDSLLIFDEVMTGFRIV